MESDFQRMQREASERLRKMSARAMVTAPPLEAPPPPVTENAGVKKASNPLDILGSLFSGSGDSLLLAGILLLLYREKGDNILMLALLYILM